MQYMLLIHEDESQSLAPGSPDFDEMMARYFALTDELREAGVMVGGNELDSVATATTVRVRDGKPQITDGPFAETKEQLGGYYLVECNDLDQAIAIAAKIPGAERGSIEVRPVIQHESA